MNPRRVYLVPNPASGLSEVYLGTVAEISGADDEELMTGEGISLSAMFADLVDYMVFVAESGNSLTITLEIRE